MGNTIGKLSGMRAAAAALAICAVALPNWAQAESEGGNRADAAFHLKEARALFTALDVPKSSN